MTGAVPDPGSGGGYTGTSGNTTPQGIQYYDKLDRAMRWYTGDPAGFQDHLRQRQSLPDAPDSGGGSKPKPKPKAPEKPKPPKPPAKPPTTAPPAAPPTAPPAAPPAGGGGTGGGGGPLGGLASSMSDSGGPAAVPFQSYMGLGLRQGLGQRAYPQRNPALAGLGKIY